MRDPTRTAAPRRRAAELLVAIVRETCGLLVPLECPCGSEGRLLCEDCAGLLASEALRVEAVCDALQLVQDVRVRAGEDGAPAGVDHRPLLPVMALGEYAGPLQDLVLAWKNGGRAHLVPVLARGLAPAARALAAAGEEPDPGRGPVLVPVPSRLGSRVRRGEDHTAQLAAAISRRTGLPWEVLRGTLGEGQEGRTARQRRRRHLAVRSGSLPRTRREGAPVILVDDVVTTGATLRASAEAIGRLGIEVVGAVVVASARLPATRTFP
ncbi:ComF family protein [Brachybacterium kimchii]|uniref:ComF family protein n=1 Tax=Brachybacterium kimchii TaxID=2942909 RepID=A0ABY4N694_9MICO|nr:phosphoribosyltransferase family protein [Brachybacterium kimchii]UQN30081.1 ComF family protein [Brachybacterium kimchii]